MPQPHAAAVEFRTGLSADDCHAKLRASLDALARAEKTAVLWFAEIVDRELFRKLGYSSIHQYAADALGFSQSRTYQFLRLAESLSGLPELRSAIASGEVGWTKAREVVKVATPVNEAHWVEAAKTSSRRELEAEVAEARDRSRTAARARKRAARVERSGQVEMALAGEVDVPREEEIPPVTWSLRLAPAQLAQLEALIESLRKSGMRESREDLVLAGLAALAEERKYGGRDCTRVQSEPGDEGGSDCTRVQCGPDAPRRPAAQAPPYQIVIQECPTCGRAHVQTGAGPSSVDAVQLEAARCDARILETGQRNTSTIPPAMRRAVLARDGHRCTAPGCSHARFLEVHHVVPRAKGGTNAAGNLVTLCSACHRAAHDVTRMGGPVARRR